MRTGRQDRLLRQREVRTEELYDFARALIEINSLEELSAEVDRRTQRLFQSRSRIVATHPDRKSLLRPGPDRQITLDENEWAVATWTYEHGKIAGWSTDTLSQARCMCLPLTAGEERLGVLVFRPIEPIQLTRDQFALLMAISHQTAGACERDRLLVSARRTEMLQESERLHQTLLNSISHELRTPLTSIVGSAQALKEDPELQSDETRSTLLKDITGAADRLNHVINNLLNMSRLNSGMLRLQKEWFDFGDVLTEVISESAAVIKDHTLKVDSIPESILVEGDYYLLKHTLANLLRNSCLYSLPASEIEIIVRATADRIDIDIKDEGKGIAAGELHRVFEKFYRPTGSPAGGIGLGLSIARSIVELHNGTITALNREGGGTVFSIRLPLRTPPAELTESRQ
jgi:two-component system sensor histidine kinase KdpD